MRVPFSRVGIVLLVLLVLTGCGKWGAANPDATKREVLRTYADIVFASYDDSYGAALRMQEAINAFVAAPSEGTLQVAKESWLAAREPYGQTEAYRFYGGPIDDEDGPEGTINSWPLDEVYIDYVEGEPDAGIINDPATYPTLDAATLRSLNQAISEESVSTGFHAIEFLLWGQDLSETGPGTRPFTDFAPGQGPNAERRAAYLTTVTTLLVEDLKTVRDAWDPAAPDVYRTTFLALEPDAALQLMLTGIGVLSKAELPGERIFTAYDNQDQEDEHSCFSDNTHRDIFNNALGIRNVYLGEYKRTDGTVVSGTSLQDLLAATNPELNGEMTALLDAAWTQVQALPAPFDRAIVDPATRPQVLTLVNALQDQGDKVAEIGTALGLTINTNLPG